MEQPVINTVSRVKLNLTWGPIVGYFGLFSLLFDFMMLVLWDLILPEQDIDISRNFNKDVYKQNPHKYGDHEFSVHSLAKSSPMTQSADPKSKSLFKRKMKRTTINRDLLQRPLL